MWVTGGPHKLLRRAGRSLVGMTGDFVANFSMYADERHVELRVLADRSVIEAFAQGGPACVSKRVYPDPQAVTRGELQTRLLNLGSAPAHFEEAAAFAMRKARGLSVDALRGATRFT